MFIFGWMEIFLPFVTCKCLGIEESETSIQTDTKTTPRFADSFSHYSLKLLHHEHSSTARDIRGVTVGMPIWINSIGEAVGDHLYICEEHVVFRIYDWHRRVQ